MGFSDDIKSRNTNLFPIVTIGDDDPIRISTNSVTLNDEDGNPQYYKPILLNVPSLKESIDIEKRNYKISNVTLDISNYECEGVRFSDMVADSSLINQEVNIYWVSQSGQKLIYRGKIRRYTHDDEKVKLVVEDRSQSILHKDLPLEYLDADDDIPDKYKNKPIPMVYGHVDRSPCLMKAGTQNIDMSDSMIIKSGQIIIDSIDLYKNVNIEQVKDTQYEYSGLYIYDSDNYLSIPRESSLIFGDREQWDTVDTSSPIINLLPLLKGDGEANNFIADGNIESFVLDWASGMSLRKDSPQYEYGNNFFSDVNNFIDRNPNTYMKINEYLHWGTMDTDGDGYNDTGAGYVGWYAMFDKLNYSVSNFYDSGYAKNYLIYKFYFEPHSFSTDNYRIRIVDGSEDGIVFDQIYGGSFARQFDTINNVPAWDYPDATQLWDDAIGKSKLIIFLGGEDWFTSFSTDIPESRWYAIGIIRKLVIDGILDKEFYVNVKGRAMQNSDLSPTAPQIISHILQEELGVSEIISEDIYDWKYDFTVNEKINSKKLIENIASTSPYIPRFNNEGLFKFNIIKEIYDGSEAEHLIKEEDCIKWSYSKTKIEDVYSKIEFFYKWDYASKDFGATPVEEEIDFGGEEYFDYYGLPTDHSESTLIIDDDRGKYIRDEETAKKYAKWMLYWHMNQHLIIKVKLPLNYLEIEIGSIIEFDNVLGNVKPYGIDYSQGATFENGQYLGQNVNFSQIYPLFMCISTNKTLEFIEIEAIQLHNLSDLPYHGENDVFGCTHPDSFNYDENATIDDGSCVFYTDFIVDGCPYETHPANENDYSSNYVGDEALEGDNVFILTGNDSDEGRINLAKLLYQDGQTDIVFYNVENCEWSDSANHIINNIKIEYKGTDGNYIEVGVLGSATLEISLNEQMTESYTQNGLDVRITYNFNTDPVPTYANDAELQRSYTFGEEAIADVENVSNPYGDNGQFVEELNFSNDNMQSSDASVVKMEHLLLVNVSSETELFTEIPLTSYIIKIRKHMTKGDMNQDGNWNVLDIVALVNLVLEGGATNDEDQFNGDMNSDGTLNVLDVVALVNFVLGGGG